MNLTKLKNYAPDARTAFIEAVTRRAGVFGIRKDRVEEVSETGDIALIGGQPFPRSVVPLRRKLLDRISAEGFKAVMEAMAYTWFNRFVAFRFMELHGYFDHGYRVLSHPEGGLLPEIVQHAEHVSLSGLDRDEVIRLKLAGNKDEELYRLLLLAQCQEMNRLLPDIFSRLDDATILLLPDNLLHTDSLVRQLVAASDPEDWQEVEVLGWLYQFYISEKKDSVMARKSAVPKEDIPAVTQLFTPHWIVRYLVENSLGRLWLLNRPGSRLRDHMPYYIESGTDSSSEASAKEDFLRITKPEEIRLCDPAVGSGHMLTYAFDLLYLIYEEEGYLASDIPGLILRHNLHGLEICPRAAQLAEFALVFKARAKSRRFFQPEHFVRPQITELQDVRFAEGELRDYIQALSLGALFNEPMLKLLHQFEEAKNFGSLIQPCVEAQTIAYARGAIAAKGIGDQLFLSQTHPKVLRVLDQAEALTQRYHVVVANPPYHSGRQMNSSLKEFAQDDFPEAKTDLFSMFIQRGLTLTLSNGWSAMVTMESWMFLYSFIALREILLTRATLTGMVHMPYLGKGGTPMGISFGTSATIWKNCVPGNTHAQFQYIRYYECDDTFTPKAFPTLNERYATASIEDFKKIPGYPIAYWVSEQVRNIFQTGVRLEKLAEPRQGMATSDNGRFVRLFHEVSQDRVSYASTTHAEALTSGMKWFPYSKGGERRKWYGNHELLVNWENDGKELLDNAASLYGSPTRTIKNISYYFRPALTWSLTSSSGFGARVRPAGFIFDVNGMSSFGEQYLKELLGAVNSAVGSYLLAVINPTMAFQAGDIKAFPCLKLDSIDCATVVDVCIQIARADWDNFETSWDFRDAPLLRSGLKGATLERSWQNWEAHCTAAIRRMQELETENNRLFIAAYGLEGELQPEVPEEQITLARAEPKKDMAAFLSYAIGCMMGRYALEQTGLILANAGDTLTEFQAKVPSTAFPPDEDGILPITEMQWFDDDVALRVEEFLRVTFGPDTLEANLDFLASSLGRKGQETPRDTLRRYLADDFYKNHLSNERAYGYKNRPIYWLFSSGKEGAFQCLVYLHRYHPGTLARMRTEYVIPLQGKLNARVAHLEEEKTHATSTPQRTKLQKEQDKLKKQQVELLKFDEQLRHYADQRIPLDLDDGVKVNYAKFGPLVAEAKKVCGTKEED